MQLSAPPLIFSRKALAQQRTRAAPAFAEHRFLYDEVGARLCERLQDVRRTFPLALNLHAGDGFLTPELKKTNGISTVIQMEISPALAHAAHKVGPVVVADEEALPFARPVFDLVISPLGLQLVNDLPGTLAQLRACLKPDGFFLAALLGGETLHELRTCLLEAELEMMGQGAARTAPLTDVKTAGSLLQRAGFALPVTDRETITVTYSNPLRLLADLRGMGLGNALATRHPLRREVLHAAMARYQQQFAVEDGRVAATFEVIYLAGWAPHASQQQPLARGSAKQSLAAALEVSAGPEPKPKASSV